MSKNNIKKPIVTEAHQWWQNGDHPLDGYKKPSVNEGLLVRRYRTPAGTWKDKCKHCNFIMHDHGWIETPEGGHTVCPGDWIITGVNGEHYPIKKVSEERIKNEL